jgi:hypothetical protein
MLYPEQLPPPRRTLKSFALDLPGVLSHRVLHDCLTESVKYTCGTVIIGDCRKKNGRLIAP